MACKSTLKKSKKISKNKSKNKSKKYAVIAGLCGLGPSFNLDQAELKTGVQSVKELKLSKKTPSVPLLAIVAKDKKSFIKALSDMADSLWDCMVEQDDQA